MACLLDFCFVTWQVLVLGKMGHYVFTSVCSYLAQTGRLLSGFSRFFVEREKEKAINVQTAKNLLSFPTGTLRELFQCYYLVVEHRPLMIKLVLHQSWPRSFGQNIHGDKWSPAGVALSTVTVAEGPFRP